jgi:hypothetical protein
MVTVNTARPGRHAARAEKISPLDLVRHGPQTQCGFAS